MVERQMNVEKNFYTTIDNDISRSWKGYDNAIDL
jgi:hypothetical protein